VFAAATPIAPNDPGVPYITNFSLTQPLSEELVVFVGKKDVLGAWIKTTSRVAMEQINS
jgi:hypothetical protein